MHLIADNLGWFEDQPVNVETLAARTGQSVQRVRVSEGDEAAAAKVGGGGGGGSAGGGAEVETRIMKDEDGGTIEMYPEEVPRLAK
jgi:hypothetical protein